MKSLELYTSPCPAESLVVICCFILIESQDKVAMNHGSRYKTSSNHHSSIRSLLFIPTYIILVVIVFLLLYNSFNIFYVDIPTPLSLLNSSSPSSSFLSLQPTISTDITNRANLTLSPNDNSSSYIRKKRRRRRRKHVVDNKLSSSVTPWTSRKISSKVFSRRVKHFFFSGTCKPRFFMTWISSLESFSRREVLTIESLFRRHPEACLLIVSASMDSVEGLEILRSFLEQNLKVMAVAPDLEFLFKNTTAAAWFNQLKRGRVKPGEISLAQNLSNLLRLTLLYKYGGIYMDTDFIILRPLMGLRNVIGAQNSDSRTGQWTRLNNAMMIFDKGHPLVKEFIDEFASTFNGNKWGYNGPYLVSRVVKRAQLPFAENRGQTHELNFTVMPPSAFYPVDWGRIGRLFQRRRSDDQDEERRVDNIKRQSYGLHLWNRQTRSLKVENGSVIARLMYDSCLFCNSTSSAFEI